MDNITSNRAKELSALDELNVPTALVKILALTATMMTVYELTKQWIYPDITLWQSHVVTIVFSSLVATVGGYIALHNIRDLRRRISQEIDRHHTTEAALNATQAQLEQQIAARTAELEATNARLQEAVAEQHATAQTLQKECEFAESVLETAQVIILELSPEGRILRINPYMEQITGYRMEDVHNKDWFTVFLPNGERESMQALLEETLEQAQSQSFTNTICTQDGYELDVEWQTKILHAPGGRRLLCIGQDITERLQTEVALRRARDELENRVRERTADLARANRALELEIGERKQAETTLKRRATQLKILNDVGSKIAAVLELEQVFDRVTTLVQENFGYHHVGLFTLDSEQQVLKMRSKAGAFAHLYPDDHQLNMEQGMVGWVGSYNETLLANDVDGEPRYVNLYADVIHTRSELSVPIRIGTEIVGVLDLQSPQRNAFDDGDVMVMETLADQVAVAIANARLYEEVQHELSERRQAEQALRESEARYCAVSEIISDFAYAYQIEDDGTQTLEWVTDAFSRITGYTPEELDASSGAREGWYSLIHPEDHSVARQRRKTLNHGEQDISEFRIVTKGNQVRWLRDYGRPVWDEERDRVTRIIGAAQDITKRKCLEQLMLRSERLAAMGYITATLAHEIKNPLQALNSNLELVMDFPLEPDEREDSLQLCHQEVERLLQITQSVLSLAQTEKKYHRQVSIPRQIQQTLNLLHHPLQKAAVAVEENVPDDLPPVLGDADQIRQVLLNLVINAIEAMPHGGHLRILADTAREELTLKLINDGPPIPDDHIEHVFEPFFTTKPEGVGLGLFISHHIIQQHGGTLNADNLHQDAGVQFTITLPAAGAEGDAV
jgi:PAS domain S-box-containing protein